jgi:hypothetical protein
VRRWRSWLAVLVLAVVATVVLVADEIAPPLATPAAGTSVTTDGAASGSWVCAVGDGRSGTSLATVAARPGAPGDGPASVEVVGFEDGAVRATSLPQLFPGADARARPRGGDELAAWARWTGAPVAVTREWRWDDVEDLPGATVAGACARPFSGTWVIPGMSTTGGNEARIRLANPYRSDATVAVGFLTPDGVEEPLALRNVTVSARSVREVVVNDSLPERADLAAVVEVASGRLAVEGYQIARSEIGDIDGGSLLAAAPESAEDWTVPWVPDGEESSSWLWVANLGERTAPVELTLHTPSGGQVPDGLAEVSVPPGQLRRVDLRGTLPDGETSAAVTVRSNGAPVVVSAGSQMVSAIPGRTGFPIQLAAPSTDATWVVSGGDTTDRLERLRLVNPGGTDASVSVVLWNGTTLLRPSELQDLDLSAGAARTVEIHEQLGTVSGWSAFVTAAGGEIVVGRVARNTGDEGWHLVATLGIPGRAWAPVTSGLVAIQEPGLVHRLGTTLGLERVAELQDGSDDTDSAPQRDGDDAG